ncbi:MAG: hypothetical protein ACLFTI_08290 [Anaerolineales bacterium]
MRLSPPWPLHLTVDQLFHAQGADPATLRQRRPHLVQVAEQALEEAATLLAPRVIVASRAVRAFLNPPDGPALHLETGIFPLTTTEASLPHWWEPLRYANTVFFMVSTIGPALDARVADLQPTDPLYALMVDALGTAAIDTLGRAVYRRLEAQIPAGWRLTRPLSPGIGGWPLQLGQRLIFEYVPDASAEITLLASGQMQPRKTISMLIGAGARVPRYTGRPCDVCTLRETCHYQGRHL